jgi:hypothetical protein
VTYNQFALAQGSTDVSGTTLYGLHVLAISSDSLSICSVGANYASQLGTGTTTDRYSLDCDVAQLAGIESLVEIQINIFPNPTSHSITIKTEKNMNQSFSIFDQMGREVFKGKLIGTETEVNLSSLSKGIYTLKIDGNYKPSQIVKE